MSSSLQRVPILKAWSPAGLNIERWLNHESTNFITDQSLGQFIAKWTISRSGLVDSLSPQSLPFSPVSPLSFLATIKGAFLLTPSSTMMLYLTTCPDTVELNDSELKPLKTWAEVNCLLYKFQVFTGEKLPSPGLTVNLNSQVDSVGGKETWQMTTGISL